MAYEPKEGRGTMFKNTRKTTDKHPEYRGDFKGLDGVIYDIAFWWAKPGAGPDLGDEIPFAPQVD
jgi:hypothetical protein